jgi:hypothetical protein
MGQQQLLLIVLGVILVGVAVVLGIQYFGVGAEEGAKDELVAHSTTIAANAQQWYKKPIALGGGGNSFTDFDTKFWDVQTNLHQSTNGTYGIAVTDQEVTITGTPNTDLGYTWDVTTTVTADSIGSTIQ